MSQISASDQNIGKFNHCQPLRCLILMVTSEFTEFVKEEDWSSGKWTFDTIQGWHRGYSWNCFSSGLTKIFLVFHILADYWVFHSCGWLLSFVIFVADNVVLKVRYHKQRPYWHWRVPGAVSRVWNRRGHYCRYYCDTVRRPLKEAFLASKIVILDYFSRELPF